MKNMKRLLAAFVVAFVGLNAHAQGSHAEYMEELARGGFDVRMHSFSNTKKMWALTVVDKAGVDTKNAQQYTAEVAATNISAYVYFRAYRACILTPLIYFAERVIMIEGQKVEADYSCTSIAGQSTQEIYKIKSVAGNDYAKKTFSEKAYVLVHLNDVPVLFNTKGFPKAFAEASAKAL